MFNVLVAANEVAWESERMQMLASRFKEYSGDEAQSISENDPNSLKRLERVPTILMYEEIVDAPRGEVVRVGQLRDIRLQNAYLTFRFAEEGRLTRTRVLQDRHRFQLGDYESSRTHWAVKDGYLPQDILGEMVETPRTYDVVLSYAGENRAYVDRVAAVLDASNVSVFYDKYEKATLWGKDLTEHLDLVYRTRGRYCVMFVSQAYADKMWTSHERRSALARAVEQKREYVLPVRFDNTDVPGLRPTIVYQDANTTSPEDLAQLILEKLGRG